MDSCLETQRIQDAAQELFNARGYKSVTIDELAATLRISKKTIYQYFNSKEEIAAAIIDAMIARIAPAFDPLSPSPNALGDIKALLNLVKSEVSQISPLFQDDIRRLLPHLHNKIRKLRQEKMKTIEACIRAAQHQGLAKAELDPNLATLVFLGAVNGIDRAELEAQGISKMTAFDTIITIFLSGITTDSCAREKGAL